MLPIDINILFGVLIVAALSAYVLVLSKLKQKQTATTEIRVQSSRRSVDQPKRKASQAENVDAEPVSKGSGQDKEEIVCNHNFGFLRTLPKNSILPAECLVCPKAVDCLAFIEVHFEDEQTSDLVLNEQPSPEGVSRRRNRKL